MIEAKRIFSGQKKRYGDYIREWEIMTDCMKEVVLEWIFNNLGIKRVPEYKEWQKNFRNEDGSTNYSYYFAGYYIIKPMDGGFLFTVYEPYAD